MSEYPEFRYSKLEIDMKRDIQFDLLDRVRSAGITEDCVLELGLDAAQRLVDGLGIVRTDITEANQLVNYEGAQDDQGALTFMMDDTLAGSVGRVTSRSHPDGVTISLRGIV